MLTQTKSGVFVVAVIAFFFIISLVIGVNSVDTAAMSVDEPPAEVIEDNDSVTVIRETTLSKPFMGDTIREASLNWADYTESTLPEPFMGDTIRRASLNWADYTETVQPESTQPQTFMGDTLHQASLNWADYAEPNTLAYELAEADVSGKPY